MRDTQKQRAYDAEFAMRDECRGKEYASVKECQRRVDQIIGSAWWKKHAGLRANGELKMDDVAEVKKTAVRQHQRTLAGDRTAVRVKEHLSKARNDAYLEWGDGELIELIDKALKALEEVVSE